MKVCELIPRNIMDKLNSPEVTTGVLKIFSILSVCRRAEIDTDHFTIIAHTVDPGNGKRAICIRIEEG